MSNKSKDTYAHNVTLQTVKNKLLAAGLDVTGVRSELLARAKEHGITFGVPNGTNGTEETISSETKDVEEDLAEPEVPVAAPEVVKSAAKGGKKAAVPSSTAKTKKSVPNKAPAAKKAAVAPKTAVKTTAAPKVAVKKAPTQGVRLPAAKMVHVILQDDEIVGVFTALKPYKEAVAQLFPKATLKAVEDGKQSGVKIMHLKQNQIITKDPVA